MSFWCRFDVILMPGALDRTPALPALVVAKMYICTVLVQVTRDLFIELCTHMR